MAALIDKVRGPYAASWSGKIATTDRLLYRRGNFTGTVDQLICAALRREFDAEIALSPGFRWGASFLPNQPLTMEDLLAETAIAYPETYVSRLTGTEIKNTLEDICDNLFNPDPYYQQGGDMVRIGGLSYSCTPSEKIGPADFRPEARQGPRDRAWQALRRRGLGRRQRPAGNTGVGRCCQTSREWQAAQPLGQQCCAARRDRQSRPPGAGIKPLLAAPFSSA